MAYACKMQNGTNVTITGDGSDANPYVINSSGAGGETILQQDSEPVSPSEDDLWIDTDENVQTVSVASVTQEGPDGATRASTTLGAFSTPWTATINVQSGQVVDIIVSMSIMCSSDESLFMAIRRGSTTIYENPHYTTSPNARTNILTHFWRDTTPGTGNVTYEVYVASNSGSTITLKNGATLDTTRELTQGKSIMRLEARPTTASSPSGTSVGELGYAAATSNQTGITTSEVDLTGITKTVTVPSGHAVKITAHVYWATTAGTPGVAVVRIKENTTTLQEGSVKPTADGISCDISVRLTPSAGSHTYKVMALTDTGTVTSIAGTTRPAFILIEDLGVATA